MQDGPARAGQQTTDSGDCLKVEAASAVTASAERMEFGNVYDEQKYAVLSFVAAKMW